MEAEEEASAEFSATAEVAEVRVRPELGVVLEAELSVLMSSLEAWRSEVSAEDWCSKLQVQSAWRHGNRRERSYPYYHTNRIRVCDLMRKYRVSAPTVYKILRRGRQRDFSIHKSVNARFRTIQYGLKRLAKVERELEEKLKKEAKRYNKEYPGEMVHFDTKRLPLLKGETPSLAREYLFG